MSSRGVRTLLFFVLAASIGTLTGGNRFQAHASKWVNISNHDCLEWECQGIKAGYDINTGAYVPKCQQGLSVITSCLPVTELPCKQDMAPSNYPICLGDDYDNPGNQCYVKYYPCEKQPPP